MSLFNIDDEGFIAQNKGREPWELVRELIQNALDSESDVVIKLDTRSRKVIVQNTENSFDNLEDSYTIFGGDKGKDPEKRGRFGRGLKEAVAGVEKLTVMSPKGRVIFNVAERERIEDDRTIDSGTKIIAENSNWDKEDFDAIKDYVFKIWPPKGQDLVLSLKGGKTIERKHWEPLMTKHILLNTVVFENGIMKETSRRTDVLIKRADDGAGDGRIYEMGIPVNTGEKFPFYINVQQKIPMAEGRNEVASRFKKKLVAKVFQHVVEDMSAGELSATWVQEALNSVWCKGDVLETYVDKVFGLEGKVYGSSGEANDRCRNYGYEVIDTHKISDGAKKAVKEALPSAATKAQELARENERQVDPSPEQEEIIEQAEEIAEELGYGHIEFQTWRIENPLNDRPTMARNVGGEVHLNVKADPWNELNQETLGTLIHEISHEQGRGHGEDWYYEMEDNFAQLLWARWE